MLDALKRLALRFLPKETIFVGEARSADEQAVIRQYVEDRKQYPLGSPRRISLTERLRAMGVQVGD